jgi:hypothetical protein
MNEPAKTALGLALLAFCLFEGTVRRESDVFYSWESAFLSSQWLLLLCLVVGSSVCLGLAFNRKDIFLVGMLLLALFAYLASSAKPWFGFDALTLYAGVLLGKLVRILLVYGSEGYEDIQHTGRKVKHFLLCVVLVLASVGLYHVNLAPNLHAWSRWTGLWKNPNTYGMVAGMGLVLATGLLAPTAWRKDDGGRVSSYFSSSLQTRSLVRFILLVAGTILNLGLLGSFSRGAWVGTAIGLLYLLKVYGKLKWRFVLLGILVIAAGIWLFWNAVPDGSPTYLKRLDLSRPSAQHRVAAWRGALEIMRDYPFGVGWNNTVDVYERNYSPPDHGALAIATNDYLMIGTQLGVPALVCFVSYVALCFRTKRQQPSQIPPPTTETGQQTPSPATPVMSPVTRHPPLRPVISPATCHLPPPTSLQVTCRAAALSMLVAFWFDGGLFVLATGSVFWVLLELGRET